MQSIVILGTGNVAKHLFDAFINQNKIEITQVYGRKKESLHYFGEHIEITTDLSTIADADIYLIAVSDDAIAAVSKKLEHKKGLIVHTSGSMGINELPINNKRGVFYPLQTFSFGKSVDFKEIPICIEALNEDDYTRLNKLALSISNRVFRINTKQRKALHLAAVFANNFTNHIYHLSKEICTQNNVSFELLHPLIKETAKKVQELSPYEAQTGPARRNDVGTLEKQLNQLKDKNHKNIYSILSKSIQKTYGEKL